MKHFLYRISLGKLAQYAMAVLSLCENPNSFEETNLLDEIKKKLTADLHGAGK